MEAGEERRRDQAQARREEPSPIHVLFLPTHFRLTDCHHSATIVAMATQPLRYVRDHLSEIVDQVSREHDRVEVTKNGRVVAVLLSSEELSALEETLAVLTDPEVLADIRDADAAYARGDVVRGVDAVRSVRTP